MQEKLIHKGTAWLGWVTDKDNSVVNGKLSCIYLMLFLAEILKLIEFKDNGEEYPCWWLPGHHPIEGGRGCVMEALGVGVALSDVTDTIQQINSNGGIVLKEEGQEKLRKCIRQVSLRKAFLIKVVRLVADPSPINPLELDPEPEPEPEPFALATVQKGNPILKFKKEMKGIIWRKDATDVGEDQLLQPNYWLEDNGGIWRLKIEIKEFTDQMEEWYQPVFGGGWETSENIMYLVPP